MSLFNSIWIFSLIIKLIIGGLVPLFSDESYYWVWSHHLQLSYFDHPPMIGWLLSLSHPLEPFGSLIRFPIIFLSHATLLIWRLILKDNLSEKQLVWFLIICLLNPLFGWGGIIATPDVPLLFFWSASIYFSKIYFTSPSFQKASLLGISLGLGFCSKYHIALFPLILIVWISLNKKWRLIRPSHLFACVLMGFLFSLPVFVWNYQNNFDSFLFQLNHGLAKKSNVTTYPVQYIAGQILLIFPVVFWFFGSEIKRYKELIYTFALIPLIFFLVTSFKSRVEANWPIIAYPAIYAIFIQHQTRHLWTKITVWFWGILLALAFTVTVFNSPELLKNTKLKEIYQYNSLRGISNQYAPLYAGSYQMASNLSFIDKKQIYKLPAMNRKDFYDYLNKSPLSESSFYVVMKNDQVLPEWTVSFHKELIEERGVFQVFKLTKGPL